MQISSKDENLLLSNEYSDIRDIRIFTVTFFLCIIDTSRRRIAKIADTDLFLVVEIESFQLSTTVRQAASF